MVVAERFDHIPRRFIAHHKNCPERSNDLLSGKRCKLYCQCLLCREIIEGINSAKLDRTGFIRRPWRCF
jgi:hypothetical protein